MSADKSTYSQSRSKIEAYAVQQSEDFEIFPEDLSNELDAIGETFQATLEAFKNKFHRGKSVATIMSQQEPTTDSKRSTLGSGHPATIMADNPKPNPSNRKAYNVEFDYQV